MNVYLKSKIDKYKITSQSKCFTSGLIGLSTIELNVSELCSRKCSFCPRYNSDIYKNRTLAMDVNTIKSLASQLKSEEYIGDITISGFGEPMLHPDLPSIIKILDGYDTILTTNGDFLTQKTLEPLIESGLRKIVVSCYDSEEQKNKFDELLTKNKMNYYIKHLWHDFKTVIDTEKFNNRAGLVSTISMTPEKQCFIPFYKLFIDWNGDVGLCSNDWHRKETSFGNINKNIIREIWLGEKFTTIRKNLADGRRINEACKNCNCGGVFMGKDSFDLLK